MIKCQIEAPRIFVQFRMVRKLLRNLSKTSQNLPKTSPKPCQNLSRTCPEPVQNLFSRTSPQSLQNLSRSCPGPLHNLSTTAQLQNLSRILSTTLPPPPQPLQNLSGTSPEPLQNLSRLSPEPLQTLSRTSYRLSYLGDGKGNANYVHLRTHQLLPYRINKRNKLTILLQHQALVMDSLQSLQLQRLKQLMRIF